MLPSHVVKSRVAPGRAGPAATARPTPSRPRAEAPPPDALDALLRFTGDPAACAKLEADFGSYLSVTLGASRMACLTFFCLAFAVYALVGAGTSGTRFDAGYAILIGKCIIFLFLVPTVRAGSARVVHGAVNLAVATNIFGSVIDAPGLVGCDTGTLGSIILFCAMPLVNGVAFSPDWRVYAAVCLAHGVRAIVQLSPLGVVPTFIACLGALFGAVVSYLHERHAREHFVSGSSLARPRARACTSAVAMSHGMTDFTHARRRSLPCGR
jgi:hypothetical protein